MADTIDNLFGTVSKTSPKNGRAAASSPASEALAAALLTGILTDLAALKAAVIGQGTVNRAFDDFSVEQLKINAELLGAANHQVDVNRHQADSNTAQNTCNAEVAKLFGQVTGLIERVDNFGAILADLDARLHALDGKRSDHADQRVVGRRGRGTSNMKIVSDTAEPGGE